jgi:hypothetical protein
MQVGIIWWFTMGPAVEEACRDALEQMTDQGRIGDGYTYAMW